MTEGPDIILQPTKITLLRIYNRYILTPGQPILHQTHLIEVLK